jgi:hypothetical protein
MNRGQCGVGTGFAWFIRATRKAGGGRIDESITIPHIHDRGRLDWNPDACRRLTLVSCPIASPIYISVVAPLIADADVLVKCQNIGKIDSRSHHLRRNNVIIVGLRQGHIAQAVVNAGARALATCLPAERQLAIQSKRLDTHPMIRPEIWPTTTTYVRYWEDLMTRDSYCPVSDKGCLPEHRRTHVRSLFTET